MLAIERSKNLVAQFGTNSFRKELLLIHQTLSEVYDALCSIEDLPLPDEDRVMGVVLEEDFQCLIDECEQYLVCSFDEDALKNENESQGLESFEWRSLTVIDEAEELIARHGNSKEGGVLNKL